MNLSLLIILRPQIWMIHGKGPKRQRRLSMGMGLFTYFYGDTIPNQFHYKFSFLMFKRRKNH